jgi:hypothetical protein
MVSKRAFFAVILTTTLIGTVTTVSAARNAAAKPVATPPVVADRVAQVSGPFTTFFRVDNGLVLVLQTPRGVIALRLPKFGSSNQVNGMQDGQDGVDPIGVKDQQPIRTTP